MLFDSHCHLDFPAFDIDRDKLLAHCFTMGISHICLPATEQRHWTRLQSLLGPQASGIHIWGALGLHPFFLSSHIDDHLAELEHRLINRSPEIVAVGEAGLDLFIDNPNLPRQEEFFTAQILIAAHQSLPLILHVRKAHDQTASLLRRLNFQEGGIIHAWSGSDQQAEAFIRLGFKLGIGGSLTYDRAKRLHKQVASFPLEHFVLETDAPDMPPAGQAGIRNTPLTLLPVLNKVASLRQKDCSVIARQLFSNTTDIFRLPR